MVNSVFSLLRTKSYETQVVLLIAFLATIRLLIALHFDFLRPELNTAELITDTAMFVLFGSMLALGLRKANFTSIHPLYGIALILLLGLNYLQFGGVLGVSRFNYYCGIFVVILLYSGKNLVVLLILQMGVIAALTFSVVMKAPWVDYFFLDFEPVTTDFVFALLALGLLAFYLKGITLREVKKSEESNEKVRVQVSYAKRMNQTLVKQGQELRKAQKHLEEEVNRRAAQLEQKQHAIETYIHLNTTVLQKPIDDLNKSVEQVSREDTLQSMLLISAHELSEVFGTIKRTLEAREKLDRNKLTP